MPTIDQIATDKLKEVVSNRLVSDDELLTIVETMPEISNFISTSAFYDFGKELHENMKKQRKILGACQHHVKRGMMHNAISRVYSDSLHLLEGSDKSYAEWFAERNIDIDSFNNVELETMQTELVKEATGLVLNTDESLVNLQTAMVNMFKQLSSYTVQFVTDIKGNGIIRLDTPAVRVGDVLSKAENLQYYPFKIIDIKKYEGIGRHSIYVNLSNSNASRLEQRGSHSVKYSAPIDVRTIGNANSRIKVGLVSTNVRIADPFISLDTGTITVPGTQLAEQLNREQLNSTGNIYNAGYTVGPSNNYLVPGYVEEGYVGTETSTLANPNLSKAVILSPLDGTLVTATAVTITVKPMKYFGNVQSKLDKLVVEVYDAAEEWAGMETDAASATLRLSTQVTTDVPLSYTFDPLFLSGYLDTNKVLHVRVKYIDDAARHSEWSSFVKLFFQ